MNRAHICIVQPRGYVHSMGLIDPALYLKFQLQRLGIEVSWGKNRLRGDAVNYVLGAHLGFDPDCTRHFACVFINLEQLGENGANVNPQYLRLLRENAAADYDAENVAAYSEDREDVPLISFNYAPYLDDPDDATPLSERPIDLLFVGSMNQRRAALIERIERTGTQVTCFDTAVYGPERDRFVRRAKSVLNVHFYESARFEQARASFVMSCGTPMVSEQSVGAGSAYERSVMWFDERELEGYFGEYFKSEAFYAEAQQTLERFRRIDQVHEIVALWEFGRGFARQWAAQHGVRLALPPRRLSLCLAEDGYRPLWINADAHAHHRPDWQVDLSAPVALPARIETVAWGALEITPHAFEDIDAGTADVLGRSGEAWLGNCLKLLRSGGRLAMELQLSPGGAGAGTAEQQLQRLLAPCTQHFWTLGWLDERFQLGHVGWLDAAGRPCVREQATRARVVLIKVGVSLRERLLARSAREDFGLPELMD